MSNLANDELDWLTPQQVADAIPGRPAVQSIWRWLLTGLLDINGHRVRLASTKFGGRRLIHRSSLQEFLRRLREGDPVSSPPPTDDCDQQRRAQEAARALDDLGA